MALDAQSVLNEQWHLAFAVTVQLKFDVLHKDKLTFLSHTGISRSGTVRTGKRLCLYFVWPFPFEAREVHHFTGLGYLGDSGGQNFPGRSMVTFINVSQTWHYLYSGLLSSLPFYESCIPETASICKDGKSSSYLFLFLTLQNWQVQAASSPW